MFSNRSLAIVGCLILLVMLFRIESRMDKIERQLDDIIHTDETVKYTKADLECLTRNIYYEAGVEDTTGKFAIAHITLNRLKTGYWGDSICKVVYARAQFSWTQQKKLPKPNQQLWADCAAVARASLEGYRVHGLQRSLFYHADYIKTPHWADYRHFAVKIGQHIFYNQAKNSWLTIS